MSQARTISKGRALYDFAGNVEQRQLSFKAGDVINITSQFDNGWWAGELNGTVGYLPATYVQLITAAEQRAAAPGGPPSAPAAQSPGVARPAAPSPAGRPGLASTGSGIGGVAGSPAPRATSGYAAAPPAAVPPAAARPPLAVSGASSPAPHAAASRPPLSSGGAAPQAISRPVAAPPSSAARPVSLTPADRGRAATLRAAPAEASDVSDADIKELDQLLSKLQSDVIDLKKLM